MAIIEMHHFSTALQRAIGLTLVVPEGAGPFPAVYQLHGLSDDHTIWSRRSSIERYADRYQLIVAMPEGGREFYCNHPGAVERAEDHILETVDLVDRMFRTIPERRARAIGGLSMGGYGSMKLGLKHADRFCSIASHSSVFAIRERAREYGDLRAFHAAGMPASDDPFALARALARSRGSRPRIRFDCGVDDFLIADNRRFHAHLSRLGIAHEYAEFPGGHSWEYWDEHIDQALRFHVAGFAAAAKSGKASRKRI
jgi:putative tributyrin esterase